MKYRKDEDYRTWRILRKEICIACPYYIRRVTRVYEIISNFDCKFMFDSDLIEKLF